MDYADKVSAFMADYDEEKNAFYQKQSQIVQEGGLKEKAGEDAEGIGLALGTVGYKITSKLGANEIAEKAVGEAVQKGTQVLKQKASDALASAKTYLQNKLSPATQEVSGDAPESFELQNPLDPASAAPQADLQPQIDLSPGDAPAPPAEAPPVPSSTLTNTADDALETDALVDGGDAVAGVVGAVAAEAIPVIGTIGAIIAGIVEIVKGHHEEKNNNASFQMPTANVDLPAYNPGL